MAGTGVTARDWKQPGLSPGSSRARYILLVDDGLAIGNLQIEGSQKLDDTTNACAMGQDVTRWAQRMQEPFVTALFGSLMNTRTSLAQVVHNITHVWLFLGAVCHKGLFCCFLLPGPRRYQLLGSGVQGALAWWPCRSWFPPAQPQRSSPLGNCLQPS